MTMTDVSAILVANINYIIYIDDDDRCKRYIGRKYIITLYIYR